MYYYDLVGNLPSQSEASGLIDELVANEKTWHTSATTFVRGRCWSAGGSAATNEMIDQHNLSGTGAVAADGTIDKERAFLFRLRAGVDSRGNPVYLRKWYHCNGGFPGAGGTISSTIIANTGGFSQTQRDNMAANVNAVIEIGPPVGPWRLCSKAGRLAPQGNNFQGHQFLEHHQFGDMWRAQ